MFPFQGKHEFDPETDEALLLGEDFDEEEEEGVYLLFTSQHTNI